MGDYNRGRSGGRSGGGFGGGGRGRGDERKELFRATCAECGKSCEVPFRPTGERPVYCSDCFRDMDNGRDDRDSGRRDSSRDRNDRGGRRDLSSFGEKRMYEAVCDQCGSDCEVPFKPSSDKPIYCSDCFVREDKPRAGKGPDYKVEFEKLEAKLDMIIKFLNISEVKKEVVKIKLPKETKEIIEDKTENEIEDEAKEVIKKEKKASAKEKTVKKTVKK